MRECIKECYRTRTCCENRECRLHLEFEPDLNCAMIAVKKNGPMTLEEIGVRHNISTVRVKQIVDATLQKLKKTLKTRETI